MKPRLLFVGYRDSKHPESGGAAIHMHEVAKRLVMRGYQVSRICMGFEGGRAVESVDGVLTFRLGGPFSFYFRNWIELRRLRGCYDLVLEEAGSGGLPTQVLAWMAVPGVVLVIQVQRKVFLSELPLPLAFAAISLEYLYFGICRLRGRQFAVDSNSIATELFALGVPENRIEVCSPAMNLAPSASGGHLDSGKREHLILVLGKLRRYKCVDHALKAFCLARPRLPDYRLLVMGSVTSARYLSYLLRLKQRLGLEGCVEIRGSATREEAEYALRSCKLLLHPSRAEGFGMVALEASSAGTPVVAYDVAGLRDSVGCGETGILVPFGDIKGLAEAIVKLIDDEDLYARLSKRGPEWSKRFQWDRTVDKLESLIAREMQKANAESC